VIQKALSSHRVETLVGFILLLQVYTLGMLWRLDASSAANIAMELVSRTTLVYVLMAILAAEEAS
jgi:hypothetical protein